MTWNIEKAGGRRLMPKIALHIKICIPLLILLHVFYRFEKSLCTCSHQQPNLTWTTTATLATRVDSVLIVHFNFISHTVKMKLFILFGFLFATSLQASEIGNVQL